jgi:hypothetical protein
MNEDELNKVTNRGIKHLYGLKINNVNNKKYNNLLLKQQIDEDNVLSYIMSTLEKFEEMIATNYNYELFLDCMKRYIIIFSAGAPLNMSLECKSLLDGINRLKQNKILIIPIIGSFDKSSMEIKKENIRDEMNLKRPYRVLSLYHHLRVENNKIVSPCNEIQKIL